MATPRIPRLDSARRQFLEQGIVPASVVAEPILRSWRRCADIGHDMCGSSRMQLPTQSELRELRQRNEDLLRFGRPIMALLAQEVRRSSGLVLLTDAAGSVLDAAGSAEFADCAAKVSLMPGALWSESAAGTNAIGTALVEHRPIEVRGHEHYFESNRILTCAAVPISDPRGRTLGLLDLSGPAAQGSGHALALVSWAVDQIERRLFDRDYAHCLRLAVHDEPGLLGSAHEGLLAFDGGRLVAANRHALRLLALDAGALGVLCYEDLFVEGPAQAAARGTVRRLHGSLLHVRLVQSGSAAAISHVPVPGEAEQAVFDLAREAPPVPRREARPPASARMSRPGEPAPWFDAGALADLARAVRLLDAGVAILLQGETGTGKEVFARQMHARSARAEGPFVAINCAALPESLIESELFGYEEGAFTGARKQGSKGLLRQAQGGVLFLDEIGDMPLPAQARFLRVLQNREVTPLGGARAVPVDFLLICATHRPLGPAEQNVVRADLYFRIAEYTMCLAALRDRADRARIVQTLWSSGALPAHGGPDLPQEVLQALAAYDWPGNFRQLIATLRTLRVLAETEGQARLDMLPADIAARAQAPVDLKTLTEVAVRDALAACGGSMSGAARRLGVHRSTLYRWVRS
ncbi:MAG: sigma-54-dependent Fis family transcriptional regulator [Bordetella sp.]|uniref:sigma-54-dependent Fis family transcriptional regulator n=1 Tax=Bordetella sp. TaxID=28081 RepID=UPI003F7BEA8C